MEKIIYNQEGKEKGKIKLPESVFGLSWNGDLVHQVVSGMLSNARGPVAHTKTRGEVSGGGKKPWKQKGTGRARHGSTRSPIWVGGGVAHGPRNDKNFDRKINKKMRVKALFTLLSKKNKEEQVVLVDDINIAKPSTKDAVLTLKSLSKAGFKALSSKRKNAGLIVWPKLPSEVSKSFRNIGNVDVDSVLNLNPVNVLSNTYLIIVNPKESLDLLEKKLNK